MTALRSFLAAVLLLALAACSADASAEPGSDEAMAAIAAEPIPADVRVWNETSPGYVDTLRNVRAWVDVNLEASIAALKTKDRAVVDAWLPSLQALRDRSKQGYSIQLITGWFCEGKTAAFTALQGAPHHDGRTVWLCKSHFDRSPAFAVQTVIHELVHLTFHTARMLETAAGRQATECQAKLTELAVMKLAGWTPGATGYVCNLSELAKLQ